MNEVIKVHDWSVVLLPYGVEYEGPCVITINIYRTKSSMLINEKDASKYLHLYLPSLERHLTQNAVQIDRADAKMNTLLKTSICNMAPKASSKKANTTKTPERQQQCSKALPNVTQHNDEGMKCKKCHRNVRKNAIQCDVCHLVVHFNCEKIDPSDAANMNSYQCKSCTSQIENNTDTSNMPNPKSDEATHNAMSPNEITPIALATPHTGANDAEKNICASSQQH